MTLWQSFACTFPASGDESGWKQVNGDVFRKPDHLAIFTVVYASGCHLACTVFIVLIFAICNSCPLYSLQYWAVRATPTTFCRYYASRGATAGSFVIAYLCTVIANTSVALSLSPSLCSRGIHSTVHTLQTLFCPCWGWWLWGWQNIQNVRRTAMEEDSRAFSQQWYDPYQSPVILPLRTMVYQCLFMPGVVRI